MTQVYKIISDKCSSHEPFQALVKQSFEHACSLVTTLGLSCFAVCGILVPPQGIKPMSPALDRGFLTIGPPRKSPNICIFQRSRSQPGMIHINNDFPVRVMEELHKEGSILKTGHGDFLTKHSFIHDLG